jgi:hypothetical protein
MNLTFYCSRQGFSASGRTKRFYAGVAWWRGVYRTAGAWRIARCGAPDCDNACSKCLAA